MPATFNLDHDPHGVHGNAIQTCRGRNNAYNATAMVHSTGCEKS
jgi:hypothetical protein